MSSISNFPTDKGDNTANPKVFSDLSAEIISPDNYLSRDVVVINHQLQFIPKAVGESHPSEDNYQSVTDLFKEKSKELVAEARSLVSSLDATQLGSVESHEKIQEIRQKIFVIHSNLDTFKEVTHSKSVENPEFVRVINEIDELKLKLEIEYLKEAQKTKFSDVSARKCAQVLLLKAQFKSNRAALTQFSEFYDLYRQLKNSKLLLRNVSKLSANFKSTGNTKEERAAKKEAKVAKIDAFLTEKVNAIDESQERLIKIVEKIKWLHGTNSSSLPILARTEAKLRPTGVLLDSGFAPMSGELRGEFGIAANGVNQTRISAGAVSYITKCLDYATHISNTFDADVFNDFSEEFAKSLQELKKYMTPEGSDVVMITLLRFKQWCPEEFSALCQDHAAEIDELISNAGTAHLSSFDQQILKMINYDSERLRLAQTDDKVCEEVLKEFPALQNAKELIRGRYPNRITMDLLDNRKNLLSRFKFPTQTLNHIIHLKTYGVIESVTEYLKCLRKISTITVDDVINGGRIMKEIVDILLNLREPTRRDVTKTIIEAKINEINEQIKEHIDYLSTDDVDSDDVEVLNQVLSRFSREIQILDALLYPQEDLEAAVNDEDKREELLRKFPSLASDELESILSTNWGNNELDPAIDKNNQKDRIALILQIKHSRLDELKDKAYPNTRERLGLILGSEITPERYLEATYKKGIEIRAAEGARFHERKLKRLKNLFQQETASPFTDVEREMVKKPFPILLGSMTSQATDHFRGGGRAELLVREAAYGKEIDFVFVPKEYKQVMKNWLRDNQVGDKVMVLSMEKAQLIERIPLELIPAKGDIITSSALFTESKLESVNELAKTHVIPFYAQPYADGDKRIHHGVTHSSRVMLWSILFAEIYNEASKQIRVTPESLILAAGLHDSAREDDGQDLWDEQSGQNAEKILLQLKDSDAAFLGECVGQKDSKDKMSLEKKIIHDADCLDIIRCLHHPDDYKPSELFLSRDLDPDITTALVREAKEFVKLTESKPVKDRIDASPDALHLLLQIMEHVGKSRNQFQLMRNYLSDSFIHSGLAVDLDPVLVELIS